MARTVKIRGLDDKFETSLCLQNITESPSCYGDAIEESCWHEAEKAFYVTFVDAAVAERVVSSGLTVGGKVLEVMHHQSQPDESGIRCTVEVRGFDPAKQELYLLYFENPNKGGGTVWELKVKEDVMLITFEEPEVAARVASMSHKVGGQVLQVTLAAEEKPCTVKVTGGDLDQEELYTMYFENPRKGGGAVSDVTVDRKLQAIFVTFEDPAVAEAVCSTSHRVGGRDLQVTLQGRQRGTGSDQASVGENKETPVSLRTVEVIVHDQLHSEDIYVHYFENRRSGGGEVEKVSINKDKGVVYVTFVRPEVAARVAGQSHKIGNLPMQVRMYVPPRPRPNYPNKLLFKNVANVTTKECLELYLERISGLAVQDVLYGDEPGVVLVSFDASPDFSKIQELCNTRRLDGNYLTVSEVQVTNCVLVEGLAPTTTTDTVCLYFESERSLGGRVEKTEIVHIGSDHNCLVFFEDYEVVDRVLTKTHKIDGRPLRVKRHIDCLGLSGGREDPSTFVLPGPLVLEVDKFKLLFIKQSSVAQDDLTGKVARVNAQLTYTDNNISAECTLTKENSTAYILARTWTQDVQQMVTSYLDQIEVHRTDVGQQVWPEVKKALDAIEVAPDCSSAKLLECVTKMVNAVTEETERKKQELTVINHNLKPHQLRLLAAASFPTESSNRHHGLSVDIQTDEQRIIFHGLNHDVKDAQIEMYHLLNSARSEKISGISDMKKKLLENAETCDLVMQKLTLEEIVAVWDVGDVDVTVHAFTDSQVVGAIDAIRKSVTEHFCHMPSSAEWLFSTPEWGKLVKSQTESYSGKVQIVPDQQNQQVVITGTDDIMHIVIREVEDFLQENTACTNLPSSSSPNQDKIDTPQPSESAVVVKSCVDELVSDLDLVGGSCCLTCSKSVAAERVASREHTLQTRTVHVQLYTSVYHDDRVLKGVPAGTKEDLLQNYLECTDITVTRVNLDKTSGSAIVMIEPGPLDRAGVQQNSFSRPRMPSDVSDEEGIQAAEAKQSPDPHITMMPCRSYYPPADLKQIDKAFQANPLDSAEMMSVHGVPKVASILVENLKPSTTSECISMYFQNRKRNRGGPVRSVEKLSDTTALVHFEECDVAESVVQKTQHSLDGQDLQVTLHQQLPGFGRIPTTNSSPKRMNDPEEPMDTDETAPVFKAEPRHEDTPKGYGFACVSAEKGTHKEPARHYDCPEQQHQQDYTVYRSSQSRRRSSGSSDEQIHGQQRTGFCHRGQPERGGRQRDIDPAEVEGNRQPLETQLRAQPQGHPTRQPTKPPPVQGSPHSPRRQPGYGIQGNQQYGPVGRGYHGQYGHPQTGDPHYYSRWKFGAQGGHGTEERGQRTPAKDAYGSTGRGYYRQPGHPQTGNPHSESSRREYGANGGRGADRGQRAPAGMGYGRGHGHDQRGPYLENASSYPTGQDRRANSTLPGPMCTVVKLGAPVIEQIQEGHGNLRELVSLLKDKFSARFQWEPPDHIIVKSIEGNVSHNWAFEVQKALNKFVFPIKVKLGEGVGLNRSQKTPPQVVSFTPHHPGGKTAAPHTVRERSPRQAEDEGRPVETLAAEDSIKLKPHQIRYLGVPQTIEKIQAVCPHLQLSLDRKAGALKMRAVRESAQRAKTHVLTFLTNIVEDKIPVTGALYQMYSSAAAQEKIQDVTDASGMICYWELQENCIWIVAPKEDIQRLKQVFNSTFIESRLTIDEDAASVVRSNSWQEFMEHMQQGGGGQPPPVLMPDLTRLVIIICDTPLNIGRTRAAIAEFFDENKPEKTYNFSYSHMKFLH
ncbi:hypothetical protein BaRGS_00029408 [Batillaria attramentaria]|uniref:RRM domain-containing protein n=1 Tax=Batillaria attramentaria TaxID=370345 RepID=A0ABD0JW71_9CAEN